MNANVASVPPPRGLLEDVARSTACRLRNARHIEALTIDLASVDRRYEVHAGVRVAAV